MLKMLLLVPINFSFWRVDYALEGSKFAGCFSWKGLDTPIASWI